MADEDNGLVLRGFFLLALISGLVGVVLLILFWRDPAPAVATQMPPEQFIPTVVAPSLASFPSNVPWAALAQLGETLPSETGWEIRYNAARHARPARQSRDPLAAHTGNARREAAICAMPAYGNPMARTFSTRLPPTPR